MKTPIKDNKRECSVCGEKYSLEEIELTDIIVYCKKCNSDYNRIGEPRKEKIK